MRLDERARSAVAQASPLLSWMHAPRPDREVRFALDGGDWQRTSYDELASLARGAAVQLAGAGLRPGQATAIILPTGPDFIGAFYGTMVAGGTPCAIAPPGYFGGLEAYRSHVARILAIARPALLVVDEALRELAEDVARASGTAVRIVVARFGEQAGGLPAAPLADVALLQFTSGSTGAPRGIRVTRENLERHLEAVDDWIGFDAFEFSAMWLPLYHDMGLIGVLLSAMSAQGTTLWMRPDQFVRDPLRWIACFGRLGAHATCAPPFAFGYAYRNVPPEELRGMDFSSWWVAAIGAERVGAAPLQAFAARYAQHGFDATAFTPGYGLAEATLAVTATRPEQPPQAARVDWRSIRFGAPLELELGGLSDAARSGRPAEWLLGCGRPLGDVTVTVEDERGEPLPERHLGEIVVRGPTVTAGYVGAGAGESPYRDGAIRTADAGFLAGGQLYVLGRMGDMVTVAGRNVYVDDLEARAADLPGLPRGRYVLLAGPNEVVALVEAGAGPWAEALLGMLARHLGDRHAIVVLAAPRGSIARTSSGKPRRRAMWEAFVEGRLAGEVVASRPARSA